MNGKILNSLLAGTALLGSTALAPAQDLPDETSKEYKSALEYQKLARQKTAWLDSICLPFIERWERKSSRFKW